MSERFYLYDDTVQTKTRFVSFMGVNNRFDLAIIHTDRFYGKILVLNLLSHQYSIIGKDDLKEPGYIEHVFQVEEEDAEELRSFLYEALS